MNNSIDQLDLIDIYRTFSQYLMKTFLCNIRVTVIYMKSNHKTNLKNLKSL
jgi:hypothetical protein